MLPTAEGANSPSDPSEARAGVPAAPMNLCPCPQSGLGWPPGYTELAEITSSLLLLLASD